jgi:hypothetical protein
MNNLNRYGLLLLGIMSVLLPVWLTIGKSLFFGVGGWLALIYMLTVAPAIFIIFWIFFVLLALRKDVRATRAVGTVDTILLSAIYISVFFHGFFLIDGGDTKESLNSVASKHYNMAHELSQEYSMIFLAISTLLILVSFVVFTYKIIKQNTI